MFFDMSTQSTGRSMLKKSGASPKTSLTSTNAAASGPSSDARLIATFAATVDVPTPPLEPITVIIFPLGAGSSSLGRAIFSSLILIRVSLTSLKSMGWRKKPFAPILRAPMSTFGIHLW